MTSLWGQRDWPWLSAGDRDWPLDVAREWHDRWGRRSYKRGGDGHQLGRRWGPSM